MQPTAVAAAPDMDPHMSRIWCGGTEAVGLLVGVASLPELPIACITIIFNYRRKRNYEFLFRIRFRILL